MKEYILSYSCYAVPAVRARLGRMPRPSVTDAFRLMAVWTRWPDPLRALARWRSSSLGIPLSHACLDVDAALLRADTMDVWRSVRLMMAHEGGA